MSQKLPQKARETQQKPW